MKERGGRPSRGRVGTGGERLHASAVEARDRLLDAPRGADAKKRRDGAHAEGVGGGPGLRIVGRGNARAETAGEFLGRFGVVLRDSEDSEAPGLALAPDASDPPM